MMTTILGIAAGGAAAVFAMPLAGKLADKVSPDQEGFGLYEVVFGASIFAAGLLGSAIAVSLIRRVAR
jgi:MFS family permease